MTAPITESECGRDLRAARHHVKWLLMFEAYFDDSGTHGGPHCFLAGYLAHRDRWAVFADHWQHLLDVYLDGRPLRMATANRLKDPGYVPLEGLIKFAKCVVEHVEFEIWAALPEYYAKQIQARYGVDFNPYRTCFLGAVEAVANDHRVRGLNDITKGLEWTFDHQGGHSRHQASELEISLIRAFNDARYDSPRDLQHLLAGIAFRDDELILPLQAADSLAWHKFRYHSTDIDAKTHPAYEILREAKLQRIEVVWFDHKLEDLLDRVTRPENR